MPLKTISRTLNYAGIRLGLHTNTPLPLQWLCEFLAPSFAKSASKTTACDVHLTIDSARYRRLHNQPRHPPRPVDCFTMDGTFESHPGWQVGGGYLLHLQEARAFLRIQSRKSVHLIADKDSRSLRIAFMRLVRELATLLSLQRDDCLLHASAVVHDSKAILFTASKGTGKTTMLLNALRADARFLANDRVILHHRDAVPPVAYGMPTIIQIRPDSLRQLSLTAPAQPYRQYLTRKETPHSPILEPAPGLPHMNISQICRWLDASAVSHAPVAALVFLSLDPDVPSHEIHAIPQKQKHKWLTRALFTRDENSPTAFHAIFNSRRKQQFRPNPSFTDIPMFQCALGLGAYMRPNVWSILSALVRPDKQDFGGAASF